LTGLEAIGPSVRTNNPEPPAKAMTDDDMSRVISAFASAAGRAQAAGFDAVQIHGAHGYLLSQFLSPYFNKRADTYGGKIENRARLLVEIVWAIRQVVSPGYPVFIKMNSEDFLEDGLNVDDAIQAALMVEKIGANGIELSGGTFLSGRNTPSRKGKPRPGEPEAYYEEAAKRYKEKVGLPLMLVGGIRTLETAQRLVANGLTDYISLSRPLIREPGLINRWKSGDRAPAKCISDSNCFTPGFEGKGVSCVVDSHGAGFSS
jgi:2,4-dienoyl-CoA reductase-like NADH-dependent reductase (Old Yellow Enzyme family)